MYFPISGVEVSPFVPVLVAFGVSFFCSMGGISGAFLLLPFQMSVLGYTNPSVSGTNHFYNVLAIPSGVLRYVREKRMVWPLTAIIAIGTLPGVMAGTYIRIVYLPNAKDFKLFVAFVLFYIAIRLVKDLLSTAKKSTASNNQKSDFFVHLNKFNLQELNYTFQGVDYSCKPIAIFILSLIVGLIGGAYGIGGGAIIAPFLVSWFGLPVHTIAGAALMGTFLTSSVGVSFFMFLSAYFPAYSVAPDWKLGILFGLGGILGMYLGAKCQKFVPAKLIKWMLVAIMIGTASKYTIDYFAL